jgi:hypothetical protein
MKPHRLFGFVLCLLSSVLCVPARADATLADPIVDSITTVTSQTGVNLHEVNLQGTGATGYYNRDKVAVEVKVVTNGTAPGASRTLTVYYAFAGDSGLTAAQLATAASNQVLDLANASSTTRIYTLPVVYLSGKYLYLWNDHTARDASSALTVTYRIIGVGR